MIENLLKKISPSKRRIKSGSLNIMIKHHPINYYTLLDVIPPSHFLWNCKLLNYKK